MPIHKPCLGGAEASRRFVYDLADGKMYCLKRNLLFFWIIDVIVLLAHDQSTFAGMDRC